MAVSAREHSESHYWDAADHYRAASSAARHKTVNATKLAEHRRDADEHAPVASVVAAFEQQVNAGPQRSALRHTDVAAYPDTSFGQLDAWANAIAWELIHRRDTKPEPVPLAICAPDLMLAAALGVLKAGKFYVAINPLHPVPRVEHVLRELDAPLLLCDHRGEPR